MTDRSSLRVPPAFVLHQLDSVGSTNDEARMLAEQGAQDGTVVWALRQSAGRGRQGRDWVSPEGNLFVSFVLRPQSSIVQAANLSFVAALAVAEALQDIAGGTLPLSLKWPNDVLLGGKKLSGILLESRAGQGGTLDYLILGIGVNLAHYPKEALYPATSLCEHTGQEAVAPGRMLEALLESFESWYRIWQREGFAPVREAWLDQAHGRGEQVSVRLTNETLQGRFVTIDEDGALDLALDEGGRRRVTAGDVFFAS